MMAMAIICILFIGPTFESTWMAIVVYGGLIVGMILAFWYSGRLSGGIAAALMGGSGARSKEKYALAEKYEIERRYDDAITAYLAAITKEKNDPAPRLKLADLYLKKKDYANCIKYLQEAVLMPKGLPENERCARINRLADLYIQHGRNRAAAVRALRLILRDYPEGRYALYARERIVQIKKGA